MTAFYNEIEPYPASWLINLSAAGKIAKGFVVQDDIRNLRAHHLADVTQAHFFAGIGVWSYALRLAGWSDDAPVWTGSCPCQPFSVAGRRKGTDDVRHLWPDWFKLIDECRPPVIFGEQVASPAGLAWFDSVSSDLERAGYAVGAADLCAAGIGAPHIRQRLYFVAITLPTRWPERRPESGDGSSSGSGQSSFLGDSGDSGSRRHTGAIFEEEREGCRAWRATRDIADELELAGATRGFWAGADWLYCRDQRMRPVEPSTFPLAHGAPGRVGRTSAYGNAIVAQIAASFIKAVMAELSASQ